jgi:hypothetical protein
VDFGRAFSTVAGFLEAEGFPVAVVGALGLHAFGVTRATQDLDLEDKWDELRKRRLPVGDPPFELTPRVATR